MRINGIGVSLRILSHVFAQNSHFSLDPTKNAYERVGKAQLGHSALLRQAECAFGHVRFVHVVHLLRVYVNFDVSWLEGECVLSGCVNFQLKEWQQQMQEKLKAHQMQQLQQLLEEQQRLLGLVYISEPGSAGTVTFSPHPPPVPRLFLSICTVSEHNLYLETRD